MYVMIQNNTVTEGDALELIQGIEDQSMDLIILDPDYQDWKDLVKRGLIEQAVRVLKPSGNIICFTKQPFDLPLRIHVDKFFRREFTWTFENGGAWVSRRMPLVSFQKFYWLTKSKDFYVNVRTGRDYNKKTKPMKRTNKVFEGYIAEGRNFELSEEGTWIRDHYHFNKPHTGKIPSKPLELFEIIVRCFCPEGGTVLDPFFGSGTSGKVAKSMGRNFIAFERDPVLIAKFRNHDDPGSQTAD